MKNHLKAALIIIWYCLAEMNLHAATFTNLYAFSADDGFHSYSHLLLSGRVLYGTTSVGGTNGNGTVFAINTDGTDFTNLYNFSVGGLNGFTYTNRDGVDPFASLTLAGNILYGTTFYGGTNGDGTIFAINTNGTGFTNIYNFSGTNGKYPYAGLVLSGSTLYGTTSAGGTNGDGTIFAISTNGMGFTNLYIFNGNDGQDPSAELLLSGNTLYGTAFYGGTNGNGAIFAISIEGTGFTNLYNFSAGGVNNVTETFTNQDGANPHGGLVLFSNILYGTTSAGGTNGDGTIFAISTNGMGFTNLYIFNGNDGQNPSGYLALSGSNMLYGTTSAGGTNDSGAMFAINTAGTSFTNLYNFSAGGINNVTETFTNRDGANPYGGLVLSSNILYGTTSAGGTNGDGVIFALNVLNLIPLNIRLNGGAVILSWSNPFFSLQIAPIVAGVYTNIPGATSPYTNVVIGPKMFFRLQAD